MTHLIARDFGGTVERIKMDAEGVKEYHNERYCKIKSSLRFCCFFSWREKQQKRQLDFILQ